MGDSGVSLSTGGCLTLVVSSPISPPQLTLPLRLQRSHLLLFPGLLLPPPPRLPLSGNTGNTLLKAPSKEYSDDVLSRVNHAYVFVKPHANTPNVQDFVRGELTAQGLTLLGEGDKTAEEIEESGAIDAHYASIALAATVTDPAALPVTEEKKTEFKTKFGGTGWTAALDLGIVFNAAAACAKLSCTGAELNQKWASNGDMRLKLAPGLYVENVADEDEPM